MSSNVVLFITYHSLRQSDVEIPCILMVAKEILALATSFDLSMHQVQFVVMIYFNLCHIIHQLLLLKTIE